MKATEFQIRLKNIAYRVVVLRESLPLKKNSTIIEPQLIRSGIAAKNFRVHYKAQDDTSFKPGFSTAFEEISETLFSLAAIVNLHLMPATKLMLIVNQASEVTRIFATSRLL